LVEQRPLIPFIFQDETNPAMVPAWHDHDKSIWTWWPELAKSAAKP
jgi:hypothetical protein